MVILCLAYVPCFAVGSQVALERKGKHLSIILLTGFSVQFEIFTFTYNMKDCLMTSLAPGPVIFKAPPFSFYCPTLGCFQLVCSSKIAVI